MNQRKLLPAAIIWMVVVAAMVITGCNNVYHTLRFENHSNKALSVIPDHEHTVDGCSVVWSRWVGSQTPDSPITVTATYSDTTDIAYSRQVAPHTEEGLGLVYDVVYTEGYTDPCPPAVTARFQVAVLNDSQVTLQAFWNGTPLGEVQPQYIVTFGPFEGSFSDRSQFTVAPLLAEGAEKPALATHLSVDYKLGDVPTIEYVIND